MSGLGEQIAVLDGLSALDPNDGRIGQVRARVNQYARLVARNVLQKRNMIQASGGANYSGGSSYFPGGPLMPSSAGLAGMFGGFPGVLPPRRNVIDPSGGANYGGAANYAPGMPLLPSTIGLAASLIEGGYGRAGLGASLINGGYGRAGLGITGTSTDEDLAAAAEAVEVARRLDPSDGRTGQFRARVDEYGRPVMPGVLDRSNVLDPSEGANYGGGSSYFPGGPLTPSNSGLAGCASCSFGAVPVSRGVLLAKKAAYHRAQAVREKALAKQSTYPRQRELHLAKMFAHLATACSFSGGSASKCSLFRTAARRHAKAAGLPAVQTAPNTQQWR